MCQKLPKFRYFNESKFNLSATLLHNLFALVLKINIGVLIGVTTASNYIIACVKFGSFQLTIITNLLTKPIPIYYHCFSPIFHELLHK